MKKLASLCLLFICLILVLFLISSPMIDLSALNHRLFAGWSVVGVPHVQAAYTDVVDSLGGQDGDPLRVEVMNNGSLAIYTWQPVTPGSPVYDYENRYFDNFSWGSNLFMTAGADQVHLYSDYYQDLPYVRDDYVFSLSADIGLGMQVVEGDSIITTWTLLDGLCQLRQDRKSVV